MVSFTYSLLALAPLLSCISAAPTPPNLRSYAPAGNIANPREVGSRHTGGSDIARDNAPFPLISNPVELDSDFLERIGDLTSSPIGQRTAAFFETIAVEVELPNSSVKREDIASPSATPSGFIDSAFELNLEKRDNGKTDGAVHDILEDDAGSLLQVGFNEFDPVGESVKRGDNPCGPGQHLVIGTTFGWCQSD